MTTTFSNYFYNHVKSLLLFLFLIIISLPLSAQLIVTGGQTPQQLADIISGSGVIISNVTVNCHPQAIGEFDGSNTNLGMSGGLLMTTGNIHLAPGPDNSGSAGFCAGTPGDPQLTSIANSQTYDACAIEFDITPHCDNLSLAFVFGSEEYPEWVGSQFNDAFAFFISGPGITGTQNLAVVPGTTTPITINTINTNTNSSYYVNNNGGSTIQYDAFTTVIVSNVNVIPCETYHMKLVIADGGDCVYDSGVFLEIGGLSCSQPSDLNVQTDVTNLECHNDCNGSVSLTVSEGIPPYTYSWSTGANTSSISGLCPGTYSFTVSDADNCPSLFSGLVEVTAPPAINTNIIPTNYSGGHNVTCSSVNDGSASLIVSGGTPGYSFQWSNGVTTQNNNNIFAGNHSVTVTDAMGCEKVDNIILTAPSPISLNFTVGSAVLCYGDNTASATVSVSGGAGSGNYTYFWNTNPPQFTAGISGLTVGTYTVTVTDEIGCETQVDSVVITEEPEIQIQFSTVSPGCGLSNGSATATASSGGGAPYYYIWSNGQTTSTISNIPAGSYSVTVFDANGCSQTSSVNVTNTGGPDITQINVTNISCNGLNNGVVNISVSGGSLPYQFAWSNGANTQNISGLAPGIYTVTVTGSNNCQTTASAVVNQPVPLLLSGTSSNEYCSGNNGSASVTAFGGTPAYTYNWSNGQQTSAITGLSEGMYTVTVTDANNCEISETFNIQDEFSLSTQLNALTYNGGYHVTCPGDSNGNILLTVSGGDFPYSFEWSNGSTSQSLNNVSAGTYIITVTDAGSCTSIDTVTLIEPPQINTSFTANTYEGNYNISCNGLSDGQVIVSVSGGVVPYIFNWSNGSTSDSLWNVTAGTYSVTITDANGCVTTNSITLTQPNFLVSSLTPYIYSGSWNISCNGASDGFIETDVYGGVEPYQYAWSTGDTIPNLSNLTVGSYTLTLTDANNCEYIHTTVLQEPLALTLSLEADTQSNGLNISCFNGSDGSISATVSGGEEPYSYSWNNGTFDTQDVDSIPAGTYILVVTDANGCSISDSIALNEPPAITVSLEAVELANGFNVSCPGSADGSIETTIDGGSLPFTFSWNNGEYDSQNLTSIPAGDYELVITDINGCEFTVSTILTEPHGIFIDHIVSDYFDSNVSCFGANDGFLQLFPDSGFAPYTYVWSTGDTTQDLYDIEAGTYIVTVSDASGCFIFDTITLSEPDSIIIETTELIVIETGESTVISVTVISGGTEPFSFEWLPFTTLNDNTSSEPLASPIEDTTLYIVTVTDINGCIAVDSVLVIIEDLPDGFAIPNVFAPERGGQNAVFNIITQGDAIVREFKVFNRWGEIVHDNPSTGWDGTFKGQPQPNGTYVYHAVIELSDGQRFVKTNTVNLVR